jgi:MoaA/NifB/PqqE/SkfB family radical SAM enzyme
VDPNLSPLWLPVGGPCNSRCDGCEPDGVPWLTADAVRAATTAGRPAAVVLTGPGEPTLRRDLADLVHAARQGGAARVALVTNGRMLAYPAAAAAVAGLRLDAVAVTLLDPDPAVHDRSTRAEGAFVQALAGARNLARVGGSGWLLARTPTSLAEPSQRRLARTAAEVGLQALWADGPGGGQGGRGPLRVVDRAGFLRQLSEAPPPPRTHEGSVPIREHSGEGAVSLVVRTGCRNACVFCTTRLIQEHNRAPWPLEDLEAFHGPLAVARRGGYRSVRLVAVEPLEHPDIVAFVAHARDLGYRRIEAWSSGRALADPGLLRRLIDAGLTHLDVPLLGGSAAVHDTVAGAPGSFDETVTGVRNAAEQLEVRFHLVVVRQNLDDLVGMLALGRTLGLGEPASVLIPGPSLEDPQHYRAFAFSHATAAAALRALAPPVTDVLAARGFVAQLPPCVLDAGLEVPRTAARPVGIRDGKLDEPGAAAKLRVPCSLASGCAAADRCPGHHREYEAVFGVEGLVPRTGGR